MLLTRFSIRDVAVPLIALLAACGDNIGADDGLAFNIRTQDVTIMPGEEVTYCYFTHTANTADAVVNRWVSEMAQGSHHTIMFINPSGVQPADGTLQLTDCGFVGNSMPIWTYATQNPYEELTLPTDDGAGRPLAQVIPANTAVYFQMHYVNASDVPITTHFEVSAYELPAGTPFTQTSAYLTYNNSIAIPPGATNHVESATCDVPAGAKFWTMSTHSHKQTAYTEIKDGEARLFETSDWEHPGTSQWMRAPYYEFETSKMTWSCTYNNIGDNAATTVVAGSSGRTNEMCMEYGFIFPADKPTICIWDTSIPGNCVCS